MYVVWEPWKELINGEDCLHGAMLEGIRKQNLRLHVFAGGMLNCDCFSLMQPISEAAAGGGK